MPSWSPSHVSQHPEDDDDLEDGFGFDADFGGGGGLYDDATMHAAKKASASIPNVIPRFDHHLKGASEGNRFITDDVL